MDTEHAATTINNNDFTLSKCYASHCRSNARRLGSAELVHILLIFYCSFSHTTYVAKRKLCKRTQANTSSCAAQRSSFSFRIVTHWIARTSQVNGLWALPLFVLKNLWHFIRSVYWLIYNVSHCHLRDERKMERLAIRGQRTTYSCTNIQRWWTETTARQTNRIHFFFLHFVCVSIDQKPIKLSPHKIYIWLKQFRFIRFNINNTHYNGNVLETGPHIAHSTHSHRSNKKVHDMDAIWAHCSMLVRSPSRRIFFSFFYGALIVRLPISIFRIR